MRAVFHVRRGCCQGRIIRGAWALVPGAADFWARGPRRRNGAIGEAIAESVPLYDESDAGLAVEINTMGIFLLLPVVEVIMRL